jgi:hypothetical protein
MGGHLMCLVGGVTIAFLLAGGDAHWRPADPPPESTERPAFAPYIKKRSGRKPTIEAGNAYLGKTLVQDYEVTAVRYVPRHGRWLCRDAEGKEHYFRAAELVPT